MAPAPSMQPRKGARGDSTWNIIQTGYVECWETELSHKTETEQILFTQHILKIPKSSPGPQLTFHVPETGTQDFSRPNILAFFDSPLHDNSPFWCPSPNIQVTNVPLNVLGQNQTPRNNSKPALPAWSAMSVAGLIWTLSFHQCQLDYKALWATGSYRYILQQMKEVLVFYFTEEKWVCRREVSCLLRTSLLDTLTIVIMALILLPETIESLVSR